MFLYFLALDPAEPWYGQTKEENRMNKEDADFVDVIHTNSGGLLHVRFIRLILD